MSCSGRQIVRLIPFAILAFVLSWQVVIAQPRTRADAKADSTGTSLKSTAVLTVDSTLRVEVRNIDITKFPYVGIIFDVFDKDYHFVDSLTIDDLVITENGAEQEIVDLSLITSNNRVPVDFVFAIDNTGSMGDEIDGVKQNIEDFTTRLVAKGIDYRLGLIVFNDDVSIRHWLTDDLGEFKSWVDAIQLTPGGDVEENALEGLRAATGMNFRSSANRVVILITDAPFHRYSDNGFGRTRYTENSIVRLLDKYDIRTFCIVDPKVEGYKKIAEGTDGRLFNIQHPFTQILSDFVVTMTSLYNATYRSTSDLIPDSVEVELRVPMSGKSSKKSFAVLEVGRKLVLENIHFASNRYTIEKDSEPELDYLVRLMKARPTLRLKVEGHTDSDGSTDYNRRLSTLRAESVKAYMVKRGIESNRLFTIGYGESRPSASNDDEEGRRLNRRTEFIILQK